MFKMVNFRSYVFYDLKKGIGDELENGSEDIFSEVFVTKGS